MVTIPTQPLKELSAVILVGCYPIFFFLESYFGYRRPPADRWPHAARNVCIGLINLSVLGALSYLLWRAAEWSTMNHFGLFSNLSVPWQGLTTTIVLVFLYDLLNYGIHRSLHRLPTLWRMHRVHHTEHYLDVTSAFYFHPAESLYRAGVQIAVIICVGLPPEVLALYQVWSVFALLFAHANLQLRGPYWRLVGYFCVLPTAHRVHHSKIRHEHDSNYGIGLQIWDYLFGSFTPANTQNQSRIGLGHYSLPLTISQTLTDPLCHRHPKFSLKRK